MATIKRIISDEVHKADKKSVTDIAKSAIYIPLVDELHNKASSDEMKWDAVGRPLFGDALNEIRQTLPKTEHDIKTDTSS